MEKTKFHPKMVTFTKNQIKYKNFELNIDQNDDITSLPNQDSTFSRAQY